MGGSAISCLGFDFSLFVIGPVVVSCGVVLTFDLMGYFLVIFVVGEGVFADVWDGEFCDVSKRVVGC